MRLAVQAGLYVIVFGGAMRLPLPGLAGLT